MNDTLIKDMYKDRVIVGFRNSDGDVEYTIYEAVDGGVSDREGNLGGILSDLSETTEYTEFLLEEI